MARILLIILPLLVLFVLYVIKDSRQDDYQQIHPSIIYCPVGWGSDDKYESPIMRCSSMSVIEKARPIEIWWEENAIMQRWRQLEDF